MHAMASVIAWGLFGVWCLGWMAIGAFGMVLLRTSAASLERLELAD